METTWIQLGMLMATILLVLVACVTAGAAYLTYRVNVDPHVIAYTKHDEDRPMLIDLVIENIGKGTAYEVRFDLDRPIPEFASGITSTGERKDLSEMNEGPIITGIPLLAPGERRVISWGQVGGLQDALGSAPVTVTANFTGSKRPLRPGFKTYRVPSLLEVRSFAATSAAASIARRQLTEMEKGRKHLGEIAAALKRG